MRVAMAVLIAAGVLAAAPAARATLIVNYQAQGGSVQNLIDTGASADFALPVMVGSTDISITAVKGNSPGVAGQAKLFGTVLSLDNMGGTTQTVTMFFGMNGYTTPTTPPALTLFNNLGGTVLTGVTGSAVTLESCVDMSNLLTTTEIACPATATATPAATYDASVSNASIVADTLSPVTILAAPFALDQVLALTLAPGEVLNISTSTQLYNAPEPASAALLTSGLLGFAMMVRRRRSSPSARVA